MQLAAGEAGEAGPKNSVLLRKLNVGQATNDDDDDDDNDEHVPETIQTI